MCIPARVVVAFTAHTIRTENFLRKFAKKASRLKGAHMGKKNNDWTKKLKGTSQRKLEALEKKVWDRKQRVAQLIKNGVFSLFFYA